MGVIRAGRNILVGLGVGGALAAMGGQEVMEASSNKEVLSVSCEQFQTAQPQQTWLNLTDCALDISDATFLFDKKSGKIEDLYIPVFPNSDKRPEKTKISLHTTDQAWLDRFSAFKKVSDSKGDTTAFLQEHASEYLITGNFEGMIEHGMTKSSSEHDQVTKIDGSLAPGFSVLRHNKKPSMAVGLGMIGMGALSGMLGLFFGVRRFRR